MWIYDAKTVKVLRGYIVAIDVEEGTAKIKTYEGLFSFSIVLYTTFNSDGLDELAESLRTCFYNDYDRFTQKVKIGLDENNEMLWVKKMPIDDPVYALELEKRILKSGAVKEEYRVEEEHIDWLISFFSEFWPATVQNPRMELGVNHIIECYWGDDVFHDDSRWEFRAVIDPVKHTIEGTGNDKTNQLTGYNFSLNLDSEEDRQKLFEVLKVLEEKIENGDDDEEQSDI